MSVLGRADLLWNLVAPGALPEGTEPVSDTAGTQAQTVDTGLSQLTFWLLRRLEQSQAATRQDFFRLYPVVPLQMFHLNTVVLGCTISMHTENSTEACKVRLARAQTGASAE